MTPETTEERTRERWKRALDLFERALPLPPTEREQILDAVDHQDQALRQTVSDLLLAHRDAESGNFLESPSWVYQPIEANPQALVGRRIGPYLLTQYLAKGGMGIVYLAERADKFFRRQVAVKLIGADTGASHYHRFKREAQILADLKHPNLVMLYDAGRLADGRLYLVMEYVEGETLREWVNRRGPIPAATVVEIIQQAAAGLHAAHEAGVIHRDIKPANIVVAETGGKLTVKVLDFGVAARKQHDGSGVSSTQGAIGTLLYMSPEQLQSTKGRDLTTASDVYALGLTAYELLTGRPANDGQSQAEIITKHLYEMPPAPSQKRPDLKLSPGIDRVILKALAKAPSDRHQSALEFTADLDAARREAERRNESTEKLPPLPPPVQPPQPSLTPTPVSIEVNKRRYVKPAIAVVATAIVLAASTYLIGLREQNQSHSQSQPTTSPTLILLEDNLKIMKKLIVKPGVIKSAPPFSDCRFILFKPEVTVPSTTVNPDSALYMANDISNPSGWLRIVKDESVEPGNYLTSFSCPGYETVVERVQIKEDPEMRGYAILSLRPGPLKRLKLFLVIENLMGKPLTDSSFALFKPGITKIPATVTTENALIFVTDQNGRAESQTADIPAGSYVWKAAHKDYPSQSGEVTLQEDPSRPGTVSLVVTMGPK